MVATPTRSRIVSGVKYGLALYVEIALWMVVLGAIGSWFSRVLAV